MDIEDDEARTIELIVTRLAKESAAKLRQAVADHVADGHALEDLVFVMIKQKEKGRFLVKVFPRGDLPNGFDDVAGRKADPGCVQVIVSLGGACYDHPGLKLLEMLNGFDDDAN